MTTPSYYLRSFGCQMNDHDAERIQAMLEGMGYTAVATPGEADILIYNTCTVRRSADERLAGHLSAAARLKRTDPRRVVALTGCLPQAEQHEVFTRFPFVDVAVGPQSLYRLREALQEAITARQLQLEPRPRGHFEEGPHLTSELPSRRARPFQAWVQVMSGCTNFCSYCVVPYVRGPERSRRPAQVEAEVRRLAADGVREVTLLGQNVNAYGLDLEAGPAAADITFAGLLRRLDAVPGIARIRFMTSHPKDLSEALIAAVAELPTVCEHVHLPAQSGSDTVLAAMRRGYTAEHYLARLDALRAAVSDVAVTTDLIVGFPGERDEDFLATLALVERARFDAAFTFVYSPRAGTAAAALPDQVPDEVKRARVQRLIALTQRVGLERRSRFVGRRLEVLLEGVSRHGDGMRGRARHNVTVNVSGAAKPGTLVEVLVTEATSTTLRGSV